MHNDPKLIQAIVDFGKEILEEQMTKKILELPYLYYGDEIDLNMNVQINKKALKVLAKSVGALLPDYPINP